MEYLANFFGNVVLFDAFYVFGWKMCSKFNFIAIFLILANFTAFLDHTKENADVSKNDGYFYVNFYIYRIRFTGFTGLYD